VYTHRSYTAAYFASGHLPIVDSPANPWEATAADLVDRKLSIAADGAAGMPILAIHILYFVSGKLSIATFHGAGRLAIVGYYVAG
jgi:hypothetical protein